MLGVPQIVAGALEATKDMDARREVRRPRGHRGAGDEQDAAAREPAAEQVARLGARVRPLGRAHCVIHGNQNYKQTGLLQAYAAYSLLQQPPKRVGFASGCQAFGHRELLGVLRSFGLVSEPVLTVEG